jgi:hypothetical protein
MPASRTRRQVSKRSWQVCALTTRGKKLRAVSRLWL